MQRSIILNFVTIWKKNLIFPFKQTSEIYTWRNTEKVLSYLNGPMVSVGSRLDWCLSEQLALISTFIVKVPWDVRTGWAERIIPLSPLWLIPRPPQKTRLKCFVKACKAISLPPAGCQHWQRSALRNTCSQEPSFQNWEGEFHRKSNAIYIQDWKLLWGSIQI